MVRPPNPPVNKWVPVEYRNNRKGKWPLQANSPGSSSYSRTQKRRWLRKQALEKKRELTIQCQADVAEEASAIELDSPTSNNNDQEKKKGRMHKRLEKEMSASAANSLGESIASDDIIMPFSQNTWSDVHINSEQEGDSEDNMEQNNAKVKESLSIEQDEHVAEEPLIVFSGESFEEQLGNYYPQVVECDMVFTLPMQFMALSGQELYKTEDVMAEFEEPVHEMAMEEESSEVTMSAIILEEPEMVSVDDLFDKKTKV